MGLFDRSQVTAQAMVCCVPCLTFVLVLALPVFVMSVSPNEMATVSPGKASKVNTCTFETDQGIIDLWSVGRPAEPRFQYQSSSAPGDTGLYTFDPCYPFTRGLCEEAMVCRFDKNKQHAETIGSAQPGAQIVYDKQTTEYPVLMFLGPVEVFGHPPIITFVTLICGSEVQEDTLNVTGFKNGTVQESFLMELTSPSCCPRERSYTGTGLSFGTILIILFLCSVVTYLVVGIIYNKCARGASGIEVIPNLSFWMDFPNLVMDGVAFVLTCGKAVPSNSAEGGESTPGSRSRSGYESI